MSTIVPRSMAPNAPEDSDFPSNPNQNHSDGCVVNSSNYTCSCGLITHLLETGAFVRYDASMCQIKSDKKPAFTPISEVLDEFLAGLRERCASKRIDKEDA